MMPAPTVCAGHIPVRVGVRPIGLSTGLTTGGTRVTGAGVRSAWVSGGSRRRDLRGWRGRGTGDDEGRDVAQADRGVHRGDRQRDTHDGEEADRQQRNQHTRDAQEPLARAAVVNEDRGLPHLGHLGGGCGGENGAGQAGRDTVGWDC